ncbi:MAG TPA: acyl-CoA dehydrogenase family protein [Usitatibacter sp.]|nr:acyl-CoA dehydrogenase family protein [Usitatibacter sp.]
MTAALLETHEVVNQSPALEGYDAYGADPWLKAAVKRAGVDWIEGAASNLGAYVGSPEAQHHATLANRYTPELRTHDRTGARVDAVEYHPSYHVLMNRAMGAGVHSLAWKRESGGFTARAALFYLWNQLEQGTACPVTMTFAAIAVLDQAPELARAWRSKILNDTYDPRPAPVSQKAAATVGMAMTEKQGGSDLRAVQTAAWREGAAYRLTGHKWFCSAPMSDAFFTLARLPEGVSCFFVPRSLPSGARNTFLIQRLKEKVGNRSNASAEIEYRDTVAWLVGEPGRGIASLIGMAHHTRFDIVVGVAGMMRAALNQAVHHAHHRSAFGKRLVEHPLMANVLADLALEAEAALLIAFRLATAFDRSRVDEGERELQRVLTPIAKYWLAKRMTPVAVEAMECLGGNGYVEEGPMARLYREAPLNGIWEGSANVICLDVLRGLGRSPAAYDALAGEVALARDARLDRAVESARQLLREPGAAEGAARRVLESLALAVQGALMKRYADPMAAEAFVISRIEHPASGRSFGALELDGDALEALVQRARLED